MTCFARLARANPIARRITAVHADNILQLAVSVRGADSSPMAELGRCRLSKFEM